VLFPIAVSASTDGTGGGLSKSDVVAFASGVFFLLIFWFVNSTKKHNKDKANIAVEETKRVWLTKHKKLIISTIVLVVVFSLIYNNYSELQKDKQSCLQSINYYAGTSVPVFFIENESGERIKKQNGKTAMFNTKDDAMEYCLEIMKK